MNIGNNNNLKKKNSTNHEVLRAFHAEERAKP